MLTFYLVKEYAVENLKKYWKYILVVVLVLGAFLGGRYSTSEKVKTVTQTVTIKDTESSTKNSNIQEKIVYQYVDRPVDRVVTKTIIKEPSGKTTETTTDSTHQGNMVVTKTEDKVKEVQIKVEKEIVYQEKIVEKVVNNGNKFPIDVGISIGYSVFSSDSNNLISPLPGRMVVGGYATYRIGEVLKLPINIGANISSRGDLGLMAGVSF